MQNTTILQIQHAHKHTIENDVENVLNWTLIMNDVMGVSQTIFTQPNKMLNQKVSGTILRMRKMCSNSHHQRRRVQEMEWDNNPNRKLIAHAETFHVHQMLY